MRKFAATVLVTALAVGAWGQTGSAPAGLQTIPRDARYACPMDRHPDEADPARRGPYFSAEPGKCPRCGMTLKPIEELAWAQALRAAGGAEVAYTCPKHQHVFSKRAGSCPRCGRQLEPFKQMYTCPDPQHAGQISTRPGACPECGRRLVPYRGIWLSPAMAARNVPPNPEVAEQAPYRCPQHPLAHSHQPGKCPICAHELRTTAPPRAATAPTGPMIPPGAEHVCPMQECAYFAAGPGECPHCGMKTKPIAEVPWARALKAAAEQATESLPYVCPMHPQRGGPDPRGTCPVCGMRLVAAEAVPRPTSAPAALATQMTFLLEHYLELHQRLAADSSDEVALHALGLVGACDAIAAAASDPGVRLPAEFGQALRRLRTAALKLSGRSLTSDRIAFAEIGSALRTLIGHVRPDRQRYPKIYVFHCPMTKGDWLQVSAEMANPFYGFRMLKCGELVETR